MLHILLPNDSSAALAHGTILVGFDLQSHEIHLSSKTNFVHSFKAFVQM